MKNTIYLLSIVSALFLTAFTFSNSGGWQISEGYSVKFDASYAEGEFTSVRGTIIFDVDSIETSKFDITIDVSSISTGNSLKDKHAKKEKWFGVDKYPTIKFNSTRVSNKNSGYEAIGILDMHGIKKEVTIPFTFNNDTFDGSLMVNRLDYKVGTDTGFSSIVGTDMKIDISVPVTRK